MYFQLDDLIRIGMAVILGSLIGAERERHKKPVGLRTLILISVGSALFTILSPRLAMDRDDLTRIAANIVSGIGFLGAGVILHEGGRVTGLTTAATIWLSAAIGMACGAGEFVLAAITTALAMIVLLLFTNVEDLLAISSEERTYEITCKTSWSKFKELKALFKDHSLFINKYKQEKRGSDMVCTFEVYGPTKKHDKLVQKIFADKEIKECWF